MQLVPPDGAFYLWPDIQAFINKTYKGQKIQNSSDFSRVLLEDFNVAVVPGVEFGMEGYIRLSFALNENRMAEAIERIRKFTIELK
jgi:aspartate aminotransferase